MNDDDEYTYMWFGIPIPAWVAESDLVSFLLGVVVGLAVALFAFSLGAYGLFLR